MSNANKTGSLSRRFLSIVLVLAFCLSVMPTSYAGSALGDGSDLIANSRSTVGIGRGYSLHLSHSIGVTGMVWSITGGSEYVSFADNGYWTRKIKITSDTAAGGHSALVQCSYYYEDYDPYKYGTKGGYTTRYTTDVWKLEIEKSTVVVTPVPTVKPTAKPTATATPTVKPTATATPTVKPTATATPTAKPTATVKPTTKPTATVKPTTKPTATPKPTATATPARSTSNTITASDVTRSYSGKTLKFTLHAKCRGGAALSYVSSSPYITVSSNGKVTVDSGFIGTATITITAAAKGNYKKTEKTIKITILPPKISITSASNSSARAMTVSWKGSAAVSGYQVEYSTSSKFSSGTTKEITTDSTTVIISSVNILPGQTYYVRVRSYKVVGGKKYWSEWSSSKKIKIRN